MCMFVYLDLRYDCIGKCVCGGSGGDRKSNWGDVVWRGRRLQGESVIPSVSPLNLNLPAPHGMSQPSVALCFASDARCYVLSEGALLRQTFAYLFSNSHVTSLDAQADHPDAGVCTNVFSKQLFYIISFANQLKNEGKQNSQWSTIKLSSTAPMFQKVASWGLSFCSREYDQINN